jgi:prophage maintenance system killer protein
VTVDTDFLSVEEVIFLHEEQLTRYGGAAGIRDLGALQSSVAMAQATFDGNEQQAFQALLLKVNRWKLTLPGDPDRRPLCFRSQLS